MVCKQLWDIQYEYMFVRRAGHQGRHQQVASQWCRSDFSAMLKTPSTKFLAIWRIRFTPALLTRLRPFVTRPWTVLFIGTVKVAARPCNYNWSWSTHGNLSVFFYSYGPLTAGCSQQCKLWTVVEALQARAMHKQPVCTHKQPVCTHKHRRLSLWFERKV